MGKEGKYDLKLAETPNLSESDTETDSEEDELMEMKPEITHPSKMIKLGCFQLMRCLTIGCGLYADSMQLSAVQKCTSILRQIIQLGCQSINCSGTEQISPRVCS